MKVSTKGTSRFLAQADIPTPVILTIADVRLETLKSNRGDENKYVLYFTTGKPMVFNVINRKAVVAAYGDDSDAWKGKPLEIYVNPEVTMGAEITGGIRVRVPAQQTTTPSYGKSPKPALRPPQPGPAENLALALDALTRVSSNSKLEEWKAWWKGLSETTQDMDDTFMDAYDTALGRIALAQSPTRRPVTAK